MKGQKEVQRLEAQRVHAIMRTGLVPTKSGIAIDGGAHVGSFSVELAQYFKEVHAFEPCADSFAMLIDNVIDGVRVYRQALMDRKCNINVFAPGRQTLTARQVEYSDDGDTEAITIDDLELPGCDLIKLDLEGAEMLALMGAKNTIKKYHPFLVIEFNNLASRFGHTQDDIINALTRWGYKEVWRDGVDRGFI